VVVDYQYSSLHQDAAVNNYDELLDAVAKMITYNAVHCLFVPAPTDKAYQISSLDQYSLSQRLTIRAAGFAFYVLIKFVGWTLRWQVDGLENLETVYRSGRLPIYAAWHDNIFLGTYAFRNRGIVFLTSQSFDGEYIARFLRRFGYGVIRGSSTRGGQRGLVEMIRGMKRGLEMGFTVDGPKGPRHKVKFGVLLLAKKTGNPVVPFTVKASRYWTVNSWDKLQIPVPFSNARLIYCEPIGVPANATSDELAKSLEELQSALDKLTGNQ